MKPQVARKCNRLVLDAAPLINRVALDGLANEFYTVPEVLAEIRDQQAREQLERLSVQIQVRQPSGDALKKTMAAARQTGDYGALSKTDLKVIALAVTLADQPDAAGLSSGAAADAASAAEEPKMTADEHPTQAERASVESDESEDDDEGWITPKNVGRHRSGQQTRRAAEKDETPADVAAMSSDMAVQNVLLHLKLRLLSVDGLVVRQLKSWALRCHACYLVTKDTERRFCPRCGNSTLLRVSYTVDASGNVRYHLRRNFQYNTRGTVYSVPQPKGGRNAQPLILAEDQIEFQRAQFARRRAEEKALKQPTAPFDADFLPGLLGQAVTNSVHRSGARYADSAPVTVGHGRRNVNEVRRHGGKKRK